MNFDFKAHDDLAKWLDMRFGVEGTAKLGLGLERLRPVFKNYLDKFSKTKIVTIAGTNGKGETAYRLEQSLLKNNKKVALWTSPHLISVTERMRFNGQDISSEECLKLFETLENLGKDLSYYEFLFLCFIHQASLWAPDVLILEVGLGGRLDAVNLFDADVTAVCSIGRDHQAILGNSLEKILYEKLGVTRAQKWCITALESKFLRTKAKNWCEGQGVKWFDAFERGLLSASDAYPERNNVVAQLLAASLEDSPEKAKINKDLLALKSFPGRREMMTLGQLRFIFIGAHNVDGFRQMIQWWCSGHHPDQVWCSFSARPKNDVMACVSMLTKLPKRVRSILTTFDHPRAESRDNLSQYAATTDGRVEFAANWHDLFLNQSTPQTIAVVGSYYFVGVIMRELLRLGSERARSL